MCRIQFSVRTLICIVTLVATALASARYYRQWYAQKYPGHFMYAVLRDLHSGDRFEEVSRYFKKADKVDAAHSNIQRVWRNHPWPIEDDDQFWHFQEVTGRHGVYLQFRRGQLVNFDPNVYADPSHLAKLNRFPVPPSLLRYGIWPILIAMIGMGVLLLIVIDRRRKCSNSEDETSENGKLSYELR